MTEIIVCGCSMEMRMAEEMGTVGYCISCLYCEYFSTTNGVVCSKKGKTDTRDNCKDWVVDHR